MRKSFSRATLALLLLLVPAFIGAVFAVTHALRSTGSTPRIRTDSSVAHWIVPDAALPERQRPQSAPAGFSPTSQSQLHRTENGPLATALLAKLKSTDLPLATAKISTADYADGPVTSGMVVIRLDPQTSLKVSRQQLPHPLPMSSVAGTAAGQVQVAPDGTEVVIHSVEGVGLQVLQVSSTGILTQATLFYKHGGVPPYDFSAQRLSELLDSIR